MDEWQLNDALLAEHSHLLGSYQDDDQGFDPAVVDDYLNPSPIGSQVQRKAMREAMAAPAPAMNESVEQDPNFGFTVLDGDAMAADITPPKFIVKDMLEDDAHGLLYGASGTFKSFWALGLAHSVCTGNDFMGRPVKRPGPVVYVCGEGAGALKRRLRAVSLVHGDFGGNLIPITAGVNIADPAVMQRLELFLKTKTPVLVIFDTFAALNSGVVENDTSAVGACLKNVRDVCRAAGAASMIVHHEGKSAEQGLRGASNFYADSDFVYHLMPTDRELKRFKVTTEAPKGKAKDAEPFTIHAQARVVELGIYDEDSGKQYTSLIVEHNPDGKAADDALANGSSTTNESKALNLLRMLYDEQVETLEAGGITGQRPVVTQKDWYDAMKASGIKSHGTVAKRIREADPPRVEVIQGSPPQYRPLEPF